MTATHEPPTRSRFSREQPCAKCGLQPRVPKMVYCRACRTAQDRITRARRKVRQMERGEDINSGKTGAAAGYFKVPKLMPTDVIVVLSRETAQITLDELGRLLARFGPALTPESNREVRLALRTLQAELDGHGMSENCKAL